MNKIKVQFDFNLKYTLESGQIFRIAKMNEGYRIFSNAIFDVYFDGNYLYYTNANESYIKRFFSLDVDFNSIISQINLDNYIKKATKAFKGLIILTQEPYETTVSFICSAFNNIKRIRLMLDKMCAVYGNKTDLGYTFPSCNINFNEDVLSKCGFGFRKKYLSRLDKGKEFFDKLYLLDTIKAKKELLSLQGIGSKVADCILLFAYRRYEVFCTDVWIKRIIEKLYFENNKQTVRTIEQFGKDYFGKYAGVAQQYLFLGAKKGVI